MILYLQKKSIQEEKYFVLGKIQGTINGKKGCWLMVGCFKHCPKGYWEGLQEVWHEWKLYKHKIFQMEKVMPSFEYEPLVLS